MDEKELDIIPAEEPMTETEGPAAEAAAPCEEAAEEAAPAKKAKKEKVRRRMHLNSDTLEWMATAALAGVILYMGYLVGTLYRAGLSGAGLLDVVFTDWFSDLIMAALAVFALLCGTVCKKHSPLWLGLPAALFAGMAVFKAYRPVAMLYGLLLVYLDSPESAAMYAQILPPLVLVLSTYLLQLLMLGSFMLLLGGKGCRWLHVALCLLWLGSIVVSNFPNTALSLAENAPRIMQLLGFTTMALLFALPAILGKKVPICELRGLQEADAAARKARKAKPETIAVIPAAEEESAADGIAETTDLSWGTEATWDAVQVQEVEGEEEDAEADADLPDDLLSDLPQESESTDE